MLSTDLDNANSNTDRMRLAYDKEQLRLEELEQLLKELRNRLKQEQKENSELREQAGFSRMFKADVKQLGSRNFTLF